MPALQTQRTTSFQYFLRYSAIFYLLQVQAFNLYSTFKLILLIVEGEMLRPLSRSLNRQRVQFVCFGFSSKKRSYYEILEVEPNFTPRVLKKKYLLKARKYHPDINKQPGALQEFKLVKQAYETLKDQQKRHLYDSGVAETPEEVSPVHNQQIKEGRKYYQNKWYGYKRPNDHDIRDQYYKVKADYFAEKPVNPFKYIASFTAVVLGLFGYDFYLNIQTKKEKEKQDARKVIEDSITDESKLSKRQLILKSYMEKRQKAHKVDL